jgi:hypothetical protein
MAAKCLLALISSVLLTISAVLAQSDTSKIAVQCALPYNTGQNSLTQVDLQRLGNHDIVILVDKSGSMSTSDCPAVNGGNSKVSKIMKFLLASQVGGYGPSSLLGLSRWDWCREQSLDMSRQTQPVLANGFTIVPFDGGYSIHHNMNIETLSEIFASYRPGGSTYLSPPLAQVCKEYFAKRDYAPNTTKPLLIGIITDGVPTEPERVLKTIVNVTQQMHYANEVTIIFFLIGQDDIEGNQFVSNLMHELPKKQARYNIVRAVPFNEVERFGLARSLANSLN